MFCEPWIVSLAAAINVLLVLIRVGTDERAASSSSCLCSATSKVSNKGWKALTPTYLNEPRELEFAWEIFFGGSGRLEGIDRFRVDARKLFYIFDKKLVLLGVYIGER